MIESMPFGRTGHTSTRTLFGAAALGSVSQEEADATLQVLLRAGVNHIDTAASYGASEERIGPWMREHRDRFFLATKTGEREYEKARDEIRRSLKRLQIEQIDLIQLHCLVEEDEWQVAMGPDGALRAATEAREEGLVRFIGVTGHGLQVARRHVQSLERFPFDSVLLPWNFPMSQNERYASEFHALRQMCRERGVAMQTIKGVTRRPWREGEGERSHATWYQPLDEPGALQKAVAWVLSHEGLFLNTPGDIYLLPQVLEAAREWSQSPASVEESEMRALVEEFAMAPLFAEAA